MFFIFSYLDCLSVGLAHGLRVINSIYRLMEENGRITSILLGSSQDKEDKDSFDELINYS